MSKKYCLKKVILVILVAQIVLCQGCFLGDKAIELVKLKYTPNTFEVPEDIMGGAVRGVTVSCFIESGGPNRVVWHIRAVDKARVKQFQICVGKVPEGFEQIVPTAPERFVPVSGEQYTIMIDADVGPGVCTIGATWVAD
jgi:hypothetical protein